MSETLFPGGTIPFRYSKPLWHFRQQSQVALNHYKVTCANVFSITHIPRNVESFHVSRRLRNFEMK